MNEPYKALIHLLESLMGEYKGLIDKEIEIFLKEDLKYRNITANSELQIIILKSDNPEVTLNIGFPFPVYSQKTDQFLEFISKGITLRFFLRGDSLRNFQRLELLYSLKQICQVEIEEMENLDDFRNLSKNLMKDYTLINYVDPYTFIGDSFIGIHFMESFIREFNLKLEKIYSKSYEHFGSAFPIEDYEDQIFVNKLVLMPDLIDIHWDKTMKTLIKSLKQDGIFFIVGRNLTIQRKENLIKIYHFKSSDPLLINKNIEDYMNDCLSPYLKPKLSSKREVILGDFNIIINPFGSEDIKTLPVELVLNLIKNINSKYPKSLVLLVGGISYIKNHILWVEKIKTCLKDGCLEKQVLIKNYDSLSEIAEDVVKFKITLGITADTSLAHMFNFIGLRNITIYNSARWDKKSMQSLSSDSPLGFCRYNSLQYPVIFNKEELKNLSENIFECLVFLYKKNIQLSEEKGLKRIRDLVKNNEKSDNVKIILKRYSDSVKEINQCWMLNLFNPQRIIDSIKELEGSQDLISSALRISPLYKYLEQENDKIY
ncbi:MAG: hypothetical protein Q7R52_01615 [archaeon]|nr:hypothetical protein [archaeon]